MKTHTYYTTPITLAPWVRHGAVALAALLLAAIAVALIVGLRSSLYPALSSPIAPAPRAAIPRAFQDEINGAAQASLAFLPSDGQTASAQRRSNPAIDRPDRHGQALRFLDDPRLPVLRG